MNKQKRRQQGQRSLLSAFVCWRRLPGLGLGGGSLAARVIHGDENARHKGSGTQEPERHRTRMPSASPSAGAVRGVAR